MSGRTDDEIGQRRSCRRQWIGTVVLVRMLSYWRGLQPCRTAVPAGWIAVFPARQPLQTTSTPDLRQSRRKHRQILWLIALQFIEYRAGFRGGRQAAAEKLSQEVLPKTGQLAAELRAGPRLPAVSGWQVGDGSGQPVQIDLPFENGECFRERRVLQSRRPTGSHRRASDSPARTLPRS